MKSTFLETQLQAVIQDGYCKPEAQKNFEQEKETMMLLKILALGQRQIDEGNVQVASKIISNVRTLAKNL